jgi:hypothetical protein
VTGGNRPAPASVNDHLGLATLVLISGALSLLLRERGRDNLPQDSAALSRT